jgi:hypothetical protein
MVVRRSNELRDAARMSFDCQVCVWFLLKEGNIIAVTGTGYDGNYIQLHWWLPSLQSRTVPMCVAWFPAPADSAACKRRHEFCVELSSGISQAIVSGWRLVVLEIPLHRKFEFLLSVPLILEYEAVLTRPQHLAACGLSGAETGRAIVTFNQRDFAAGTKALIAP